MNNGSDIEQQTQHEKCTLLVKDISNIKVVGCPCAYIKRKLKRNNIKVSQSRCGLVEMRCRCENMDIFDKRSCNMTNIRLETQ